MESQMDALRGSKSQVQLALGGELGLSRTGIALVAGLTLLTTAIVITRMVRADRSFKAIVLTAGAITTAGVATSFCASKIAKRCKQGLSVGDKPNINTPSDVKDSFESVLESWVAGGKEDEDRQEAADLIRSCKVNGNEILILSGRQVRTLPDCLWTLSHLKELHLDRNQLTELPSQIEKLTNLTTLDLAYNQLTKLPSEIGKLAKLVALDLSQNQLTQLPSEIGTLVDIRVLKAMGNQLTELPKEIENLKALRRLILNNNQFTTFPECITRFEVLEELELRCNQIAQLPSTIGKLLTLTRLVLGNNRLSNLPKELADLKALTYLCLGNNQINTAYEVISLIAKRDGEYEIVVFNNQISKEEKEKIKGLVPSNPEEHFFSLGPSIYV
jgi:Leucine-rich repeat (LRR) protein